MRKILAVPLQLLLAVLLVPLALSPAAAGPPGAIRAAGPCVATSGVSVVVDLTDLGGEVVVGCAAGDPATGRQALVDAQFTVTDAPSGLICAINAAPDPCPVTFDGSYWSYWSAGPGADWTAYAVGADSSDPAPGAFEGWRYNDGSAGPSVLPAALETATATAPPPGQAASPSTAPAAEKADADPGPTAAAIAGLGVVALLLAATVGVVLRRRRVAGEHVD